MVDMTDAVDRSYAEHAADFEAYLADPARMAIAKTWTDPSYLANKYEARMGYELGEYLRLFEYNCVTIGDGRGGLDSIRLRERGARSVLPTDISPFMLDKAKKDGLIADYRVENAEQLSFEADAFDFVFTKESLHHCPRAPLAIYEMLRVARHGIVLIEPQDQSGTPYEFVRRLRARGKIPGEYEDVGNFVYRIRLEELYKTALALNLPCVAHRYENFASTPGFDFIKVNEFSNRAIRFHLKRLIRKTCATICLIRPIVLLVTVFKTEPSALQRTWFATHGWKLHDLQKNPHWS